MADNDDLLADLFQHPGWKELEKRYRARKEEDIQVLAKSILHLDGGVDPSWVDETRGFWRGCEYVLRQTRNAGKAFEVAIKDGESA